MTLIEMPTRRRSSAAWPTRARNALQVFLDIDGDALRQRITSRVSHPDNPEAEQRARAFCLSHVDAARAAATRQPAGTLMLRSDKLTPAELADEVLARTQG